MSPRQPRDIDDEPLQRVICGIVADPDKAASQIAADERFMAALEKPVIDHAEIEAALEAGANPDRMLKGGIPALHAAVERQDEKLVALLIRYDAELGDVDSNGATALDTAYRVRAPQIIRQLTEAGAPFRQIGADPRYFLPDDENNYQKRIDAALLNAVRKGTPADMRRALALGASPDALENATGRARYCALHLAIAHCDPAKVEVLLNAGADVHAVSGRGETSMDMLWWVGAKDLLGPAWQDIYQKLDARGARTLFSRRPEELTITDLRANVPIGLDGKTTAMHFLVRMGKVDFVMDVIARSKSGLMRADLLKRSDYYGGETLLEAFIASRKLSSLFTSAVWRDRLDDMLGLRPYIENNPRAKPQVDFDRAARDIRRYQQELLRRTAEQTDGIRLKPRPRTAQKPKKPGPKK